MKNGKKVSVETRIVHNPHLKNTDTLSHVDPIYLTSTFKFKEADHGAALFAGKDEGYIYTRLGNPNLDLFAEKMAIMEGCEAAIVTASGMSAIASVAMTLAKPDDNFVSCASIYGGTFALFTKQFKPLRIDTRFISPEDSASETAIEKEIDEKTKFLYIETPANPTLDVLDIELWANLAKKYNIPLVVDNTFPTPYLSRPIEFGADIVVHSATKYLSGHGDIVGGVITGTKKMMTRINKEYVFNFGPTISPFNAWLFMRGTKTLALRMRKHCENAQKVAEFLDKHPNVEKVYYPGLPSHPHHELAKKQMSMFGGMISFVVKGGIEAGKTIMNNVELCSLAVSLGDCDTLIQHPPSMTHAAYSKEDREKAGMADGLIRISIGIEDADDIIADLDHVLEMI